MKYLLRMYEKKADRPEQQLRKIREMLLECQDELESRGQ